MCSNIPAHPFFWNLMAQGTVNDIVLSISLKKNGHSSLTIGENPSLFAHGFVDVNVIEKVSLYIITVLLFGPDCSVPRPRSGSFPWI
jgi:hypothetical protein